MRKLLAIVCACSMSMTSQVTFAVDASSEVVAAGRVELVDVGSANPTSVGEEMRRLERERRRALAEELRSAAVVQILAPTTAPHVWQLLGSDNGTEWTELGIFHLRDGEVPPARTGRRVPVRFLVGDLVLTDGGEITHVVAAASPFARVAPPAEHRLLFFVHSVEADIQDATAQAAGLIRASASESSLDLGEASSAEQAGVPETVRISAPSTGNVCVDNCRASYDVSFNSCERTLTNCTAAVTAVLAVCEAGCIAAAGGSCIIACLALADIGLAACIADVLVCKDTAYQQLEICMQGCPNPACPAFSTAPSDSSRIVSALCLPGHDGEERTPGTPIVIDVDGREGFRFTDTASGVWFDIDADGIVDRTAWTQPGYGQAFLVLDRNGNGTIDDGRELFGDVTAQPSSATPNGYLALEIFDGLAIGGNDDGLIGPDDAVFEHLGLWVDENHDGASQPEELSSLREARVEHIALDYVVSNRRDRHGNLLRYKALVATSDRMVQSTDVFFLVEPPGGSAF
jgi:hypothetical protein